MNALQLRAEAIKRMATRRRIPQSWAEIQYVVRAGLAPTIYSIGDQLTCNRGSDVLTWDIIGFDQDIPADSQYTHTLTLQLHDCYKTIQFDAPEALFYAETELPARTYNFPLLAGYDTAYGGGKTYYFTLTQPVPAGGQITFPWGYQVQASTVKVSTYANRTTTTAIETVSVTEGSDGTPLTPTNHTHRIRYGSNNYSESALRQWLNSDAAAGSVWVPQTIYDRPPSWASGEAGFLNGIDADFLAVIGAAVKRTAKNTVSDGGGYYDISTDKIFLLSRGEVGMQNENNINEGEPYQYYYNMLTDGARNDGEITDRIKYLSGAARFWWLRSPFSSHASYVRSVNTVGSLHSSGAYNAYGVAPACVIF